MANIGEPTEESIREYNEWVASRPERIRAIAERFRPWKLYRFKDDGHRALISSIQEPEDPNIKPTLTVYVSGQFNLLLVDRMVCGVDPDDLEECDLPGADEPLGTFLEAELEFAEKKTELFEKLFEKLKENKK